MTSTSLPPRGLRIGLSAIAWLNLLSALIGMAGLTIGDGMGLPPEWIEGSVFPSYFWPGIILGAVVGGSQAVALFPQYNRFRLAWGLDPAAGLTMIIWIFVEIAIVLAWSPLQGIFFTTGLAQTILAVLALGAWPRPLLQRTEK